MCSEVILGFWKFRQSVRPDETGKLVNTLVQRKLNDQLRGYYKEAEHLDRELSEDERELTALLPAKNADPAGQETQAVWELLYEKELSAQDHLVAYTVYLGIDKQVIAKMLNMSGSAVTRSLKRCRKALTNPAASEEETKGHA